MVFRSRHTSQLALTRHSSKNVLLFCTVSRFEPWNLMPDGGVSSWGLVSGRDKTAEGTRGVTVDHHALFSHGKLVVMLRYLFVYQYRFLKQDLMVLIQSVRRFR